ncbi:MAG: hypothetical protein NVS1B7_3720 [Candidatus Saccharimonadales bacterium]
MYSGTTITRFSGRMLGAHQKIDRVARRHLNIITKDAPTELFPAISKILHFEGQNGPDSIKRKSPAKDEPWHYFNPFNDKDDQLIDLIEDHFNSLVHGLKSHNQERVAFEAAWMAHAIVDGLTPAHHFPYEETLIKLRGGLGLESRTTIKDKWVIPGENKRALLRNNWKMWGAKGLIMTHAMFEMGVASLIKPLTFSDVVPTISDMQRIESVGIRQYFRDVAREVAVAGMYDTYIEKGWTPKLAYDVRHKLAPAMVKSVTLAWYAALVEAKLTSSHQ